VKQDTSPIKSWTIGSLGVKETKSIH